MKIDIVIRALVASGGDLRQDTLRAASGSYQAIQWILGSLGLAHKIARGKRQVWQLVGTLDETIARLQSLPPDTDIVRPNPHRKGKGERTAGKRDDKRQERYHWRVVYDPFGRFTEFSRFGETALRDSYGANYDWIVDGLVLKHDMTEQVVCFYAGQFWEVAYDPRGPSVAAMQDDAAAEPRAAFVEGLTLRHNVTGEEICFYQGRFQALGIDP